MATALLYFITCISFFLLAFIAFFNPAKVNVVANRWLGLFFASVAFMLLTAVIVAAGYGKVYPRLIGFNELTRYAMAPALYLAIVQFTTPGSRFNKKDSMHFIPFGLFLLWMVPVLYFPHHQLIDGHNLLPPKLNLILGFAIYLSVKVQLLVYWILAYRCLYYHQKHIELITSDTVPVNLNWLKYLLLTVGGMLLLFYIFVLFKVNVTDVFTPLMYLTGGLIILYYALAQKEVYSFQVDELKDISQIFIDTEEKVKPAKQRLTDEQSGQLQAKLRQLMLNDKLYLDSELNLPQLADRMEISVHDLSYLLNEKLGVNFFQFVNYYRVEEAKQLMASEKHKHLNILGIAYSAGFNAKTTFNTAFKKETGLSPSQFIQQIKTPQNIMSSVE